MVSVSRQRLVLATLCLALFMAMLDNVVVSNALPRISTGLGTGLAGLQWVMEGYSLVYAALLMAGGTLGDRFGRRGFFLSGLALFTAGSVVCGLAGTIGILIAGRALQGVGAAALAPQSLALLRTTYLDDAGRSRAIGIWSGVSGLGLALGPVIGGPLVTAFGWRSVFWINVPVGVVAVILGLRVVPTVPGRPARFDTAGQACSALGLAAAVYALVEGPVRGWTSAPVLTTALVAALCLAGFVPVERRSRAPMVDLALLRDRVFGGAVLAGFIVSFGMFGVLTYLGVYLQSVLGWSPTQAGLAALPSTGSIMLLSPVAAWLAARYGARLPLVAGLVCCAAGVGGVALYGVHARYGQFWWLSPVIGIGMGLSFSPITIVVMRRAPVQRAGMASATTNASREIGGVAGIAVMGAVMTARLGHLLPDRLAAAGLPGPVARRVTDTVTTSGAQGLGGAGAPAAVRAAISASLVDGLHLAALVAAALLLAGAAGVATLIGGAPRRPGSPPGTADPSGPSANEPSSLSSSP